MSLGERILEMFIDLPLTRNERKLFVNRENELRRIENIARFMHSSIYGVAGETGSGKTTLFNMMILPEKGMEKVIISISEKEAKEAIIADLLRKLCEEIARNSQFSAARTCAKESIDFLDREEIRSRAKGIKIGKIVEGESRWAAQARERYNLPSLINRLEGVFHLLTSETKVVLCIDEIDKETKKDVVTILDSLKGVLRSKNLLGLVTLPQTMYAEYLTDRYRLFKEDNLENILKDVIIVERMKDKEIREILDKRSQAFPRILPDDVRNMVVEFADGNPRYALLLCQNALLSKRIERIYAEEDFILTVEEIKNEMRRFIEAWQDSLRLSSREEEMLRIVSNRATLSRQELLRLVLRRSKMPRSTLNKTLESLLDKGILLKKREEFYQVDRKVRVYYEYFCG
jgi:ABC-type dipeptide/oligopeptide/nickel transport system ATPase subunit